RRAGLADAHLLQRSSAARANLGPAALAHHVHGRRCRCGRRRGRTALVHLASTQQRVALRLWFARYAERAWRTTIGSTPNPADQPVPTLRSGVAYRSVGASNTNYG